VTSGTYTSNITNTASAINATVPAKRQCASRSKTLFGETELVKAFLQSIPDYLPVGFVARRCGVSNTTVLRWINTGQLPAFRLPGGHFRIGKDAFSDFLTKYNMPLDI